MLINLANKYSLSQQSEHCLTTNGVWQPT